MLHQSIGPRVRAAGTDERDHALAVIIAAFGDDPACRALWPDLKDYRRSFPQFVELFSGPAQADVTDDGLGAALWLAPGVEPDPEPLMAYLEATLPPDRRGSILAGLESQGALHPHEPLWYLPFIGVLAEGRSRGIGGALLAHGLARADRDGVPAYLEATSRRSARLYLRFGFEPIGIVESPDYPEIVAMRRPARG